MDLLRREQTPSFVRLHNDVIAGQVRRAFRLRASYPYLLCRDLGERERAYRKTIDFSPTDRMEGRDPAEALVPE
jgi:hypothetical protein